MEESAGHHWVLAMRQGDNIKQRVTQLEERISNMSGSETLLLAQQLQNTADKINQIEQRVGNLTSRPLSNSGMQGQYACGEMQMRVRQLEVKTDTFEGIVTTLHRDIEQCITTLETIDRQRKVDKEMIESNERKIRSLERTLALKDMTIMDLDARIQSLEYASYDGILLWRIPEFSKHRLEAQQGKTLSIYSPAFYTSRTGYKMCIRMYPNGDEMGKGSHMSLFFVIMRGPYDALLSWPFMQRITFMLTDQNNQKHVVNSFQPNPASSSFKRPTSDMNIESGYPLFIPHKCLDDPSYGYIKEDTVFIKTVVDTSDLTVLNDNRKPADVSSTKHTGSGQQMECQRCLHQETVDAYRDQMDDYLNDKDRIQRRNYFVDNPMAERNRFQKHVEESDGQHLVFVMRQEDNINQRVTQLEERINNMSGSETLSLARQLQNTADKMNQIEQIVGSLASRPLSDSSMQEQHVENGEMQMRSRQLEVKTDTFEGIVTTLHRDIEQCITTLETIDRQRKVDKEMIESNEHKIRSLERTLALKDMTIMDLDARIQSLEHASYDGILLWRIPEFSKHRLEAQRGKTLSIDSTAFYTSHTGYKMCIRMYPNGNGMGKGSHMSLFFVIMKGPYDAVLSWPFMQHVTFMLIDQNNQERIINSFQPNPASSSFKQPTSDMNIESGCPLFIPHKHLDDPSYGYIKEDTMYIKTVVDTANLPFLNDNKKPKGVSRARKHSG